MRRLDPSAIDAVIDSGLAWTRDGQTLVKTHLLIDFRAAIRYVHAVADLAEAANHHPDIDIRWNEVTLRLTTHDINGLSDLDLALASQIDEIAGIPGPS